MLNLRSVKLFLNRQPMKSIAALHSFEQIKCLADPRRLEILRRLMAGAATLSQLGLELGKSPAWVQHHMRALQSAQLVELSEVRITGRATEKLYKARASALVLEEFILPSTGSPLAIFSGSDDLALNAITEHLEPYLTVLGMRVGSLDGLVNLRQGLCQFSGAHLLDQSGEYNIPFVRHLFPDRDMAMITLANRTQGLLVAAQNPRNIRSISDIAPAGVRFINRNRGSGTRLWFDTELHRLSIPGESIDGYEKTVRTHAAAAALVKSGEADVALGLQAAAYQYGLSFIPLFEERYDLILPRENMESLLPLLDFLQTAACRSELSALPGYNSAHSGEQIAL